MYSQQILAKVNIHDLLYDLARVMLLSYIYTQCQTTVFPVDITSDTCYVIGCFYLFIQEYKKAADMNDYFAQYNLGNMYMYAKGVDRDYRKAFK